MWHWTKRQLVAERLYVLLTAYPVSKSTLLLPPCILLHSGALISISKTVSTFPALGLFVDFIMSLDSPEVKVPTYLTKVSQIKEGINLLPVCPASLLSNVCVGRDELAGGCWSSSPSSLVGGASFGFTEETWHVSADEYLSTASGKNRKYAALYMNHSMVWFSPWGGKINSMS